MVHDFNQVCNVLILRCLNEPLSKVTLDCNVEHLFLIACQARSFDFLLNLEELFGAKLHHLGEFSRA